MLIAMRSSALLNYSLLLRYAVSLTTIVFFLACYYLTFFSDTHPQSMQKLSSSAILKCAIPNNVLLAPSNQVLLEFCAPQIDGVYNLFVYVRSVPWEQNLRNTVRNTWGGGFRNRKIPLIFFMGKNEDNNDNGEFFTCIVEGPILISSILFYFVYVYAYAGVAIIDILIDNRERSTAYFR